MTKLQTVLLAILAALIAGALYKFVPDLKDLSLGLAALAFTLLGWAKQHPVDAKALEAASTTTTETITETKPTAPVTDLPASKNRPSSAGPLAVLLLGSLLASTAWAQTSPQLGGCVSNGAICFGTAADVVVTKIGLSPDNKGISGGFSTGVGYGVTVAPDKFYASGLDLFLNVALSGNGSVASRVSPALMLHLVNYLFAGVALDVSAPTDTAGSYGTGWSMLLGFGSTITSITPGYAKAEASRQLTAERASAGAK